MSTRSNVNVLNQSAMADSISTFESVVVEPRDASEKTISFALRQASPQNGKKMVRVYQDFTNLRRSLRIERPNVAIPRIIHASTSNISAFLTLFLRYVCRHPVLQNLESLKIFMTSEEASTMISKNANMKFPRILFDNKFSKHQSVSELLKHISRCHEKFMSASNRSRLMTECMKRRKACFERYSKSLQNLIKVEEKGSEKQMGRFLRTFLKIHEQSESLDRFDYVESHKELSRVLLFYGTYRGQL